MLNKPVGCWYNSERKWERQKQNKMLCKWNALKKTKYFNQYLNSSNVGQSLLISLLTAEATRKMLGPICTDMKKCCVPLEIKRHLTFIYHVSAVLCYIVFSLDCSSVLLQGMSNFCPVLHRVIELKKQLPFPM